MFWLIVIIVLFSCMFFAKSTEVEGDLQSHADVVSTGVSLTFYIIGTIAALVILAGIAAAALPSSGRTYSRDNRQQPVVQPTYEQPQPLSGWPARMEQRRERLRNVTNGTYRP